MWKHALLVSCLASLFFYCTAGKFENTYEVPPCGDESDWKVDNRIVNGMKAVVGELPQQVSLRRGKFQSHFCGGSILTPHWVLTAAHCVFYGSSQIMIDASSIIAIAGEVVIKKKEKSHQWCYGKEIIAHPEFNLSILQNDVALLHLKTPFVFDPYVHAIPVMRQSMDATANCLVCGWGHTKEGGPACSSELLYVDVPLIDTKKCKDLMKNFCSIPPGTICAGYIEGGKDACQGDSGGGLICGKYLTGVVSGGQGCARPKRAGLYADVAYYVTWIENYVNLKKNYPVRTIPHPNLSATLHSASTFVILVYGMGVLIYLLNIRVIFIG